MLKKGLQQQQTAGQLLSALPQLGPPLPGMLKESLQQQQAAGQLLTPRCLAPVPEQLDDGVQIRQADLVRVLIENAVHGVGERG